MVLKPVQKSIYSKLKKSQKVQSLLHVSDVFSWNNFTISPGDVQPWYSKKGNKIMNFSMDELYNVFE